MARDHSRTALLIELGNREIQNPVQCVEHALDVAASLRVNDRITVGDEQISGADHIRPAEEHHQVAVCMSTRLVEDLNWFAVEKQLLLLGEKRRGGQRIVRRRRLASGRAIHPVERGLMCDDADCGIVVAASTATTTSTAYAAALPRCSDGGFRFLDSCISAGMISVDMRIDNDSNRFVSELLSKLRQKLFGEVGGARIHQQNALVTNLGSELDVAGQVDHVYLPLHRL